MACPERLRQTPAALGYTFPAEWEAHAATWFSWPRPEGVSFPGAYHKIPANLAAIIRRITPRERVNINVPNDNWEYVVRAQLRQHGCRLRNIRFHYINTNENWCRDHGPAFVVKSTGRRRNLAVVDWDFNAYGGTYFPWAEDDVVPSRIAYELDLPVFCPGIVMEGGSVDFNGLGTILTTESCLLSPNRNPTLSKTRIEQYLKVFYGQKHVCWLGEGIAGDDTDGHVDDLARFLNPRTIAIAVEPDPRDVNYAALQDNLRRLQFFRDLDGRPFNIVQLPMPGVVEYAGYRLPATYVNFYFVNGAVLVPTYRHRRKDAKAMEILRKHLPGREIIGIDCTDLIWGLGAIHCLTQQQPAI
jgi:agmatine deiminase